MLSIIIVAYKSISLLKGCLASISEYNDLDNGQLEVIIVDNSPPQEAQEIETFVRTYKSNFSVKYIKNENLGYGQGNNVGIKAAKGSIVAVMNPDIVLQKPIFRMAMDAFNKDNTLAMLGGKQLGGRNISFYTYPESEYYFFSTLWMLLLNKLNIYNPSQYYLSGAFLFFDKKKFFEAGAFDERIFMYYEEPDITKRILKKKYRISFNKDMIYRHLIDDREEVSDFSFQETIKSFKYYCSKYNIDFKQKVYQKIKTYRVLAKISKLMKNNRKVDIYLKNAKRYEQAIQDLDSCV